LRLEGEEVSLWLCCLLDFLSYSTNGQMWYLNLSFSLFTFRTPLSARFFSCFLVQDSQYRHFLLMTSWILSMVSFLTSAISVKILLTSSSPAILQSPFVIGASMRNLASAPSFLLSQVPADQPIEEIELKSFAIPENGLGTFLVARRLLLLIRIRAL